MSTSISFRRISWNEGNRLTDRTQIKFGYGHHHQQPQQQGHYDELDPFRSGVREPSKQPIHHGQPPAPYGIIQRNGVSLAADTCYPLANASSPYLIIGRINPLAPT